VVALHQPDGGYVAAEPSVRAHAAAAVAAGAELHTGEQVLGWEGRGDGVVVTTDRASYEAGRVVLCPGAWAPGLLRLPALELTVERQVVAWFDTAGAPELAPDRFPVFIVDHDGENHYGIPDDGHGLKVGRMHFPGETGDPDLLDREASAAEVDVLCEFAARWLPAAGKPRDASACLFTNTPDRDFVLDVHPDEPNAIVASVCSGHGFKFAPVAGEILADLALDGETRHPIDFLRLDRF
jgi:sarcosine oxidase